MPYIIEKLLRLLLQGLKRLLKSSKVFRALSNADEFSDLYEHEKMLADAIRMNCYRDAIKRYVRPEDVIVDLGTGTGILSFFAAQQKPKKIYAIDHSDFINVARRIAEHNNINNIQFVKTNSRNFTPSEKIDVILHEQIDDNLFDENMIENILDLKNRMLKKTGRILPSKFELFLEPISLKKNYKIPFIWENRIDGIDFGFLKNSDVIEKYKLADYKLKWPEASAIEYFLCEPKAIFAFNINELKDKNDIPKLIETSKKVVCPGTMDGLCVYFKVIFDDEIYFDTSPLHTKTHWGNPFFRIESRTYEIGEYVSYKLTMEDIFLKNWSVSINHD
jgi:protein arginine N-methyltransferase 1